MSIFIDMLYENQVNYLKQFFFLLTSIDYLQYFIVGKLQGVTVNLKGQAFLDKLKSTNIFLALKPKKKKRYGITG